MVEFNQKFNKVLNKFLNKNYGILLRMRELHWEATNRNVHNTIDEVWYSTNSYLDSLVEQYIGLFGQDMVHIKIVPELCNDDIVTAFERMKKLHTKMKTLIPEEEEFDGMRANLDNYITQVLTSVYLTDMQ